MSRSSGGRASGRPDRSDRPRPPLDPRLFALDPVLGRSLIADAVLAVIIAAALITQAAALASIVARAFIAGAGLTDLSGPLRWLLLAVAVRAGASWARDLLGRRTASRVRSQLRRDVTGCMARRWGGGEETGAMTAMVTDGLDALDGTFCGYLPALVSAVVVPPILVGAVFLRDATSSVVLLVTLPLVPIFMVLIGLAARRMSERRLRTLTVLSGDLLTLLRCLPTIRLSRAVERCVGVVRSSAEAVRASTLSTLRVAFLSALVLELLAALGVAIVAVVAGVRLVAGTVALEPVLFALFLAPEAFWPLRHLGQRFHSNEEGAAAARASLDLLAADPPITPAETCRAGEGPVPNPAEVALELAGVSVTYPGRRRPALDRASLTFAPGEQVAVLGSSGAGKTTLAAVILGLLAPDAGIVRIGDTPLDAFAVGAWHDRIAWVPQSPADLPGTVRELVTAGAPGAGDDEVWSALATVRLDVEVARLADGIDTRVGPGGRGLSVGQRRRLALARALLRPPGLVVLDEPTGVLDVVSEAAVREALALLRGLSTVVVCTHRIGLSAGADRVVVLVDGRIAEVGPPADLFRADGPYARLADAARPIETGDLVAPAVRPSAPLWTARPSLAAARPMTDANGAGEPAAAGHPTAQPVPAPGDPVPAPGDPVPAPGDPVPVRSTFVSLIWTLVRPDRWRFALAAGAATATPVTGVALVALSTYLISSAALRPGILELSVAIAGVRALSLLKGTSRYVERLVGHDVALRLVVALRVQLFRGLVPQAPAGLQRHRSGDVLSRVVADVDRLQIALVRGLLPVLAGGGAALVVIGLGVALLPMAGAVLAVGLLVAGGLVPLGIARSARRVHRRLARARGHFAAELVEVLDAASELAVLGRLDGALEQLDRRDAEIVVHEASVVRRGGGADALVHLVLGATTIALVLVAVPAVASGALAGVYLGAVVILAFAAAEVVGPLPGAATALAAAAAAADRLREVVDATPPAVEQEPGAGPVQPGPLHGDELVARYPGASTPAVRDVSVTVAPGRRVAVVGPSGAGKSTLAQLTVRFLDPVAGCLDLAGVDLRHLAGDEVRGVVGLVTQETHLLGGTIAGNLRLAAPEATSDELRRVLELTHLDTWVAGLPDGLETRVGPAGQELSGGQRHRLALARSLLAATPLLVLDEPTADLDPITGRALLVDVLAATADRGVLLLTHDLRALPIMDEVLVMDRGAVVARGTHEELCRTTPTYAVSCELDGHPATATLQVASSPTSSV